jgi:hypothetical protein
MKKAFITYRFSAAAQETVDTANEILDEYEQQGFRLSLRQLYYQMVARGYIENTVNSYKRIGDIVSKARQAGQVDWDMIEDRGRETVSAGHWKNPAEIVRIAAAQFRIDKWEDQPYHIECMVEKDALSGVLEPVCRDLDISITANKGYSSSSTMYEIGRRLYQAWKVQHKLICILYLGDHDPSGMDMTRDVQERLVQYSEIPSALLEVVRLALNYDQVERWQPPENPAKQTDSRFAAYQKKFGESSWELDAVEPVAMANLVRELVESRRDDDAWGEKVHEEETMRTELYKFASNYGKRLA